MSVITAWKLAGFFAAHSVWSVSEGSSFDPIVAWTDADEKRQMARLVGDEPTMVELGRKKLSDNEMDATDGVLLYDGRITLGDGKIDAILIEIKAYFATPIAEAMLAIPYTPPNAGKFLIHKPKLLEWKNCDDFDMQWAFQSFFEGVEGHEHGSKIWNESLDESK